MRCPPLPVFIVSHFLVPVSECLQEMSIRQKPTNRESYHPYISLYPQNVKSWVNFIRFLWHLCNLVVFSLERKINIASVRFYKSNTINILNKNLSKNQYTLFINMNVRIVPSSEPINFLAKSQLESSL